MTARIGLFGDSVDAWIQIALCLGFRFVLVVLLTTLCLGFRFGVELFWLCGCYVLKQWLFWLFC